MLSSILLASAAATQPAPPEGAFPGVDQQCERAALPIECRSAGRVAFYSRELVTRCQRGSDNLRFDTQKRNSYGNPTQEAIDAKCGDAREACLANWRVFITRTQRANRPALNDEIKEALADDNCWTKAVITHE